jgi:hypothetical protein
MSPRLALTLCGLAFLGFGVAFLAWPEPLVILVDVTPLTRTGTTEIRAMYGGLEIGLGSFLLLAAARREHVTIGLRAALFAFGGLAAGRLIGLAVDGWWQPSTWLLMSAEIAAVVLAAWALRVSRAGSGAPPR